MAESTVSTLWYMPTCLPSSTAKGFQSIVFLGSNRKSAIKQKVEGENSKTLQIHES